MTGKGKVKAGSGPGWLHFCQNSFTYFIQTRKNSVKKSEREAYLLTCPVLSNVIAGDLGSLFPKWNCPTETAVGPFLWDLEQFEPEHGQLVEWTSQAVVWRIENNIELSNTGLELGFWRTNWQELVYYLQLESAHQEPIIEDCLRSELPLA